MPSAWRIFRARIVEGGEARNTRDYRWTRRLLSTGCPQFRALHPLFGFSSGRYPEGMQVQHTPRASRHAPRFPNKIREYRLKAGLSQAKLAAHAWPWAGRRLVLGARPDPAERAAADEDGEDSRDARRVAVHGLLRHVPEGGEVANPAKA